MHVERTRLSSVPAVMALISRQEGHDTDTRLPQAAQQRALKLRRTAPEERLVALQHAAKLVPGNARAQGVWQRPQDARAVAVAVLGGLS